MKWTVSWRGESVRGDAAMSWTTITLAEITVSYRDEDGKAAVEQLRRKLREVVDEFEHALKADAPIVVTSLGLGVDDIW